MILLEFGHIHIKSNTDINQTNKTDSYRPVLWHRNMFTFEGCRNIDVSGNDIDDVFMPLKALNIP